MVIDSYPFWYGIIVNFVNTTFSSVSYATSHTIMHDIHRDMPVCSGPPGITGELVTPTAAALLKVLVSSSCRWMANNTDSERLRIVGRPPPLVIKSVGIGAGTKNFDGHPNILRLILGERVDIIKQPTLRAPSSQNLGDTLKQSNGGKLPISSGGACGLSIDSTTLSAAHSSIVGDSSKTVEQTDRPKIEALSSLTSASSTPWTADRLVHLETNIDDTTPEVLAYTMQKLLDAGAIDVWIHPIVMKKGRSAQTLHCLCHDDKCEDKNDERPLAETLLNIIFRQTTTLGVRINRNVERIALHRQFIRRVQTPYTNNLEDGCVDVKLGSITSKDGEEIVTISAEFDHCRRIADATGIPLKQVSESAIGIAKNAVLSTSETK